VGFSLYFMRIEHDRVVDADRAALAAFLGARGLRTVPGQPMGTVVDAGGAALSFDGSVSDLSLDPLDQGEPISGSISHATLSPDECDFVYGMCVAAGFLVVNPQGDPLYLVPGRTHEPAQLPDPSDAAWVDSGAELATALGRGFEAFLDFKRRAVGGDRGTARA
jgi:hypothetical protein